MAKVTIRVKPLAQKLQSLIWHTKSDEARSVLCFLLEGLLMDTDNYKGFMWVDEQQERISPQVAAEINILDPGFYRRTYFGINEIGSTGRKAS